MITFYGYLRIVIAIKVFVFYLRGLEKRYLNPQPAPELVEGPAEARLEDYLILLLNN